MKAMLSSLSFISDFTVHCHSIVISQITLDRIRTDKCMASVTTVYDGTIYIILFILTAPLNTK